MTNIINDGIKYNPESDDIEINFIKSQDKEDDDLQINRIQDSIKKLSYNIYYGLESKGENSKQTAEKLKYLNSSQITPESLDNLRKIMITSSPPGVTHLIEIESSKPLVKYMINILQAKYRIPEENIVKLNKRIYNNVNDIVNQEKYDKADPTTRKMMDSFKNSLLKKNIPFPTTVRKSDGLQSGARGLLNPMYDTDNLTKNVKSNKMHRFLVVDDLFIGGSTFKEIFSNLSPILKNNELMGYALVIT